MGKEIGKEIGREEGRITLICKKLRKGQSIDQIADALEEEPSYIQKICKIAETCSPEYNEEEVIAKVSVALK